MPTPTGRRSYPVRLLYQTPVAARNALGTTSPVVWADAGHVWAEVSPTGGTEGVTAGQGKALLTHEIRTPFGAVAFNVRGRFVLAPNRYNPAARVFNVGAVRNDNTRNTEYVLGATEVVSPPGT